MQSPQHRRTWDLIPWLINGTASAPDRALAESHLAVCADCRDEHAFQSRVHAGIEVDTRSADEPRPAFDRLLARIDAERAAEAGTARPRRLLRALAATVAIQAIGLAALATWAIERHRADDEPAYRTLSAFETVPSGASLRFVPSPELNVGQLQRLLGAQGLHIVGTNDGGTIYTLAPVAPVAPGRTDPDVVARLRATPGVLLVEPIASSSDR